MTDRARKRAYRYRWFFALLTLVAGISPSAAQQSDPLFQEFIQPPHEARPLAYWQWVNGNVTEDGIRSDLAWMQRIGMGGVFLFDIGFGSPPVPQYVEKRVGFATPEWRSAVRVAAAEAKRLDLSFGAQTSGGWSVSGGPDVRPEQAMKKLVWSETIVGSDSRNIVLPPLPKNSGPFQDFPSEARFPEISLGSDVAVIAYRLSEAEAPLPDVKITGAPNPLTLVDSRYDAANLLVPDDNGSVAIHYHFAKPITPGSVTIAVDGPMPKTILTDGNGQRRATLEASAAVSASVHSFTLSGPASRDWTIRFDGQTKALAVREARFGAGVLIDRFEEKAGFGTLLDYDAVRTPMQEGTPADQVINLTGKLMADGRLDWKPSTGRWAVLRFGWSLNGRNSVPAPKESTGLEVDKLDSEAVRDFATRFYDRYRSAIGPDGRMDIALTDSWEAKTQNWSPNLGSDFKRLRGYDPYPWFPVLAGRIIGSSERSERFLADWRRTIADLIADNHYGVFADILHARGMTYYAEAPGTDLPTVADSIQSKQRTDVPMGEYWYWPEGATPKPEHIADIREAASAAHLSGKPLIAAEALTTMGDEPWATGPREWRKAADRFFAEGVNRIVLHTSVHQPFTDGRKPGITLRQYGQHFTRNESWAELAGGWIAYLARTSYMLQQGRPVADLAVYYGEDAAIGAPHGYERPNGHDYDFVDRETLLSMHVDKGKLQTAAGAQYPALIIAPNVKRMSVPVLRKIREFVNGGGIIIGEKPRGPIGLGDNEAEFDALAAAIWSGSSDKSIEGLASYGVQPDLVMADGKLDWKHRKIADGDIYFLSNPSSKPYDGAVSFRKMDAAPNLRAEIWNAENGTKLSLPVTRSDHSFDLHLTLPPQTSRFILLRKGDANEALCATDANSTIKMLDGPWTLRFLDGMGTPPDPINASLGNWAASPASAIRYYSGRAIYSQNFNLSKQASLKSAVLDLGNIGDMARVRVNGRDLGVVWTKQARIDLGSALKPGGNHLEIEVANYWQNRMIGDAQAGAEPWTFSSIRPYNADAPLRPAGLMGPVSLRMRDEQSDRSCKRAGNK